MLYRRHAVFGAIIGSALLPTLARAQLSVAASIRQNGPGAENEALGRRAGLWDVTETVWAKSGAAPVTTTGLVAERRVLGPLLQELLRPAADSVGAAIERIDYLSFNRVEGRWHYVSMDVRAPVGIMPAWSFERGDADRIDLTFEPFAIVSPGQEVGGQMLRMTQTIILQGPDRDMKEQYFLLADGSGSKWLAHRYEYVRRA